MARVIKVSRDVYEALARVAGDRSINTLLREMLHLPPNPKRRPGRGRKQ